MEVRLQKFLSGAGIASRRKAEELIAEGRIAVNGQTVASPGIKVDAARDEIFFDGRRVIMKSEMVYIMLHKPEGYITTAKDQFGRETVMDLVKDVDHRLFPVGRLDYDTSGLLILTNDGNLTYRLTHPKHNVDKVYIASIVGKPTEKELEDFRKGMDIDGYKTAPASIEIIKAKNETRYVSVKITIREGKNRQVRNMCEAMGHPVASLKRVAIGKLFLGALPKGEYRKLAPREIEYLLEGRN